MKLWTVDDVVGWLADLGTELGWQDCSKVFIGARGICRLAVFIGAQHLYAHGIPRCAAAAFIGARYL